MKIKTEKRTVNVTLRIWRGGWSAGYEPDCFDDLGREFAALHPEEGENGEIIAPEEDLTAMIEWWEAECAAANRGEDGDGLQGLTAKERERGDEWVLTVTEVGA